MANTKCQECGCSCSRCILNDHDVHLHVEIENLKQRLVERDNHILSMETNFLNEANKFPNGEMVAVKEELLTWQDKYKRLYEAHRRVQRVNQGLEDKLLKLVDTCETDKTTLTKDVATLSHKLAEANYTIKKLTEDNERYKNDVALAIQFLQCKPGNFISQKVDSLPNEVQAKVSSYLQGKRKPEEKKVPEVKSIKVPIPTFPPTAMVYSVPKSPNPSKRTERNVDSQPVDIVSAAIMAKVLEERERERANMKHCDTCTCSKNIKIIHNVVHHTVSTQTTGEYKESSCLKCNKAIDVQSNVKIVKASESVKSKNLPIYVHDNAVNHNVVKVQPNNFLTDVKIMKNDTRNAKETDGLERNDENVNNLNQSTIDRIDKNLHHQLCDMSSQAYELESNRNSDQGSVKGPRYCSMRLKTGSKNILLDNTHSNVAPVLYTRHDNRAPSEKKSETSASTFEELKSIASDDNSFHDRKVAEWIENLDSDNSRSDSVKTWEVDREKYAEMEENVKRFLFGESEFLKTVELGKQKYLNYKGNDEKLSQS